MAAHRYWRIFSYWVDEAIVQIAECELRESEGGADVTGSGTASASSEYGAGYEANKGFDNTVAVWASANNSYLNQWLKYDFGVGQEKDIVEVAIAAQSGLPKRTSTEFELQYSDDNTNWTKLYEYREIPPFTDGNLRVFNSSNVSSSLDFAPHQMTSANTPSPYIISSSTSFYVAWQAFNGRNSDGNWLLNGFPGYVKLDLGSGNEKNLKSYSIISYGEYNRVATGWTIHGSNDDNQWDLLDTQTSQTPWNTLIRRDYNLSSTSQSYRYYKITITASQGDGTYVGMEEIFLYYEPVDHSVITLKYRTGATSALCEAATYQEYIEPFDSEGFVQLRVEG